VADTRDALLRAASTLLAKEGPSALTVRRIAAFFLPYLQRGELSARGFDEDHQLLPAARRAVDPAGRFIVGYVQRVGGEGITFVDEKVTAEQAGGSIAFRFRARDAHLVLSRETSDPIPFRLLLDGAVPGPSHGVDVDEDGNGLLQQGRLYQLARQNGEVGERMLEITFAQPGAEAYVFTFG